MAKSTGRVQTRSMRAGPGTRQYAQAVGPDEYLGALVWCILEDPGCVFWVWGGKKRSRMMTNVATNLIRNWMCMSSFHFSIKCWSLIKILSTVNSGLNDLQMLELFLCSAQIILVNSLSSHYKKGTTIIFLVENFIYQDMDLFKFTHMYIYIFCSWHHTKKEKRVAGLQSTRQNEDWYLELLSIQWHYLPCAHKFNSFLIDPIITKFV